MGYDGTIKIDTSINSKGMAKGTKSISASLGGVMRSLKGFAALMGVAFSAAAIGNFVKSSVASFNLMGTAFGDTIKRLTDSFALFKSALTNAVMASLNALAPYIIIAVNWLTKLLTTVAQVVTALFGVSAGMGEVADATGEAGKSAKGALAGFDQLNVLSKDNAADSGSILPPVTVPPDVMAKVEEFKTKLLEFLQPVTEAFARLKESLAPLGKTIWEGLVWAWENIIKPLGSWVVTDLLPAFLDLLGAAAIVLNEALIALQPAWQWIWENLLLPAATWTGEVIIQALGFLTEKLNELSDWIKENPQTFQDFIAVVAIIAVVFEVAKLAIAAFAITVTASILAIIALFIALGVLIYLLITRWEELKTTVKQILFILGYYIATYFLAPLINGFGDALDWISDKFTSIFKGIKSFVKGIINNIIDFINGMVNGIVDGINTVVGAANLIGNIIPGYSPISFLDAPKIPHLATGAIIPPNAQFAAILGDQKSGRNIEAPEGLIRQIVSEEMGKIEANIKIEFGGSLGALVRELKPLIDKENVRVGGSLIKSGVIV